MYVDENVIGAIENYFIYGLPPGSFTACLICDDPEEAKHHAHPMIMDYIDDHYNYAKLVLPPILRGKENFKKWQGYHRSSDEEKLCIELYCGHVNSVKAWIKKYNERNK